MGPNNICVLSSETLIMTIFFVHKRKIDNFSAKLTSKKIYYAGITAT